jgi:hypothetical protein
MPDSITFIQLAADNFRRATAMKEMLVAELEQKHKSDPRPFFPDAEFLAIEESFDLAISQSDIARASGFAVKYDRLVQKCARDFRRHMRTINPPRQRSPLEQREQRLNRLVRDIAAGKIADYEEFAERTDAIFGS